MRDPFKNRTIEDLAMQYALLTSPSNPPTKMYSAADVHREIIRRCCVNNVDDIGLITAEIHIENARNILKMVSHDGS
jgi:hypothetical protein